MRKHKTIYFSALLLMAFAGFFSCTKQTVHEITNVQNTNDTTTDKGVIRTISGLVSFYTPLGSIPLPIPGAKVWIENTNISAISDSSGIFVLKNVPEGTYTIAYTKDNFGLVRLFNFYFPGYGEAYLGQAVLHPLANYTFYDVHDSANKGVVSLGDTDYLLNGYLHVKNPDAVNPMGMLIVFGNSVSTDITTGAYIGYSFLSMAPGIQLNNFSTSIYYLKNLMKTRNLPVHGVTVYFKAYPCVPTYNGVTYDYTDPVKGGQYTSLGPPVSGQFVLP